MTITKRNVIFLDVDGVLNRPSTKERFKGAWGLDAELVERAKQLIEDTNAMVVLSSSWRHMDEWREHVREQIPFEHETPRMGSRFWTSFNRGVEIQTWLLANQAAVREYAILDDAGDMLLVQRPCFFQTLWEDGLTEEIADRVRAHLS